MAQTQKIKDLVPVNAAGSVTGISLLCFCSAAAVRMCLCSTPFLCTCTHFLILVQRTSVVCLSSCSAMLLNLRCLCHSCRHLSSHRHGSYLFLYGRMELTQKTTEDASAAAVAESIPKCFLSFCIFLR